MIKIDKYVNGDYDFPNPDINPELKLKPDYNRRWAEAVYSMYASGNTAQGGFDGYSHFEQMEAYSNGNQDTMQYQAFFKTGDTDDSTTTVWDDNSFTKEAKRAGLYSLLFQNLSPAPKIMASIHGMFDKLDYDIVADMIDPDSRGLVEFMKYKKFHEAKDREFQIEYKKKAGIPVDEDVNFPTSKEELDAYEAREGFKLNIAKAMQKLLRYSFSISAWDSVVRKKFVDDLLSKGYGCAMDYFDDEDNKFKTKWLDPKKTVLQFSHEYDYSDSTYGGYFEAMTISNIRRKVPGLMPDQIVALAKNYKGRFGNPSRWSDKYSALDPETGTYACEGWKVPVFYACWIDSDSHKSVHWKGAGGERIYDIGYDTKVKSLTPNQVNKGYKQDVKKTIIRQAYHCMWVVDSDIVFDFGKVHMGARPEMSKPVLPIHAEQLLQPSLIFRLKPILDQIALTWIGFQNDLANMVQRGYAINMFMLMGISMNGKELDPASILNLWKRKGLLPYMPSSNGNYTGGMALPVTPIEGGLGQRVAETMETFNMLYKSIEDVTGINPLSLGASPDPNAPVSTSEAALRATANVLKPIADSMFELKESIATSICSRLQIGLRVSPLIRKSYAGVVPPADIQAMIFAEQGGAQYGIALRARPDEKMRAMVAEFIKLSVQNQSLTSPEAMWFLERLEAGEDITQLRQEIGYSIEKTQAAQQEAQTANIQAQNEGLMQLESVKAQNQAQLLQLEGQMKAQDEMMRAMGKMKQTVLENNYKMLDQARVDSMIEDGIIPPQGATSQR